MSKKILLESLNIGIKSRVNDAVIFKLPEHSTVAMVTTKNQFAAAPVNISKSNISLHNPRYILVNSGNANACTGILGIKNAVSCTETISDLFSCSKEQVLLFSTGIIGRQLPIKVITRSLKRHTFNFKSSWVSAAKAIMTTDKTMKYISKSFYINKQKIKINAVCKGAGMIEPNMATMLSFISIDAKISKSKLQSLLKNAVDMSFNAISVDGDMSTNDSVVLIANSLSNKINFNNKNNYEKLKDILVNVCQDLSSMIIEDGEGATKIIKFTIYNAKNVKQSKLIAYSLANSNLIKTAMFGADPNWGRIIARLGSIENIQFDNNKIILKINGIKVFEKGIQSKKCDLSKLNKSMKNKNINIEINMQKGKSKFSLLTSDLTHEYVKINSTYTS